jgi:hypothetical protein
VASYESIDGAVRAVTHLVELQYDPKDVAISPDDYRVDDRDRLGRRLARGLKRGSLIGALTVGLLWTLSAIGFDALFGTVLPAVAAATVLGALAGVVTAIVQHRRAQTMTWGMSEPRLVPRSFAVVVSDDDEQANHDLARWWDPAASPSHWKRSA